MLRRALKRWRCEAAGPPSKRPRAGFTLIELMVSAAILSIMGLLLVQIFSTSKTALRQGTGHTTMHTLSTTTMDKLAATFVSINPDPAVGDDVNAAIYSAAAGPQDYIMFCSCLNFFGATDYSDLSDLDVYRYRIALRAAALGNEIVFQQYAPSSAVADPATAYAGALNATERVLARSTEEATIEELLFTVAAQEVKTKLRVSATVRSAVNQERNLTDYEITNITSIPYFSTQTD